MIDVSKITQMVKPIGDAVVKRSPELLTALGISGFITTIIVTAKIAPEASKVHDYYVEERDEVCADTKEEYKDKIRKVYFEEAKESAKLYAPVIIMGGMSTACIIYGHRIQARRAAAIATAYSIAERTLHTYQEKVIEKLGDEGHKELMQAVSDKLADDDAPFDADYEYKIDSDGKCLCYDRVTGRYFRSTPDAIRAAESEVNKMLIDELSVPLSEFYYRLGLDDTSFICNGLGWDIPNKLDVYFTSMLDNEKRPCLVINYNVSIVDRRIFSKE